MAGGSLSQLVLMDMDDPTAADSDEEEGDHDEGEGLASLIGGEDAPPDVYSKFSGVSVGTFATVTEFHGGAAENARVAFTL